MKDAWDYCCDPCYAKQHRVSTIDSQGRRDGSVKVVLCPDNEFRPGATFDAATFGLARCVGALWALQGELNHGYWPQGMVVEYKGKLYQVEGAFGERQSVVELPLGMGA
jgi:hypothetical protein